MELIETIYGIVIIYTIYKICDCLYRLPQIDGLTSKWILITGCDSGFGQASAISLDQKGLNVFAACLTEKGEKQIQELCSSRCKTVRLDISDSESIQTALKFVKQELPKEKGLWGLINNAGVLGKMVPPEWLSLKDYQQVIDVNLFGTINTTMAFLPLIKLEKGRIINTSSIVSRLVEPLVTSYAITKFGIECFSDAIRRQLKPYGVTVHIIQPSGFQTNIATLESLSQKMENGFEFCPKDIQQEYGSEYVDRFKNILRNLDKDNSGTSDKIYKVVEAYEHALLARFPHCRYMVGGLANFFYWPISILPEWLADWILANLNPFAKNLPTILMQKEDCF